MVDDLGSDVADNIEVQNERALVLVRISIVATNLGHTEVNKVVAVRLLVVIDPTDNSAGFGALETEHIVNFVQEEVTLGFEHIIRLSLTSTQIEEVHFRVLLPIGVGIIKHLCVRAVVRAIPVLASDIHILLDLLFLALVVRDGLFDLLRLDVVAQLLFNLLAETLDYAVTIILEGLINSSVQKEFPDDEDIPGLALTDITIDKSGCYGTFSLCYDTGDSPAGELYLNVSFDEQFVPSPKVGYDTF